MLKFDLQVTGAENTTIDMNGITLEAQELNGIMVVEMTMALMADKGMVQSLEEASRMCGKFFFLVNNVHDMKFHALAAPKPVKIVKGDHWEEMHMQEGQVLSGHQLRVEAVLATLGVPYTVEHRPAK